MKASEILSKKGTKVFTIDPHSTIGEALNSMIESKVGSMVVVDGEQNPIGILTERDILRLVNQRRTGEWHSVAVREVMVENIIIALPDDDVEYIMALMTKNFYRHVPIISEGKLEGLISIGDIVKSLLKDIKAENRYLSDYISGKYPA